ncbi:putative reverse transcriptase domain-containing protein, partial [Tanacetum coccineum]
MAQIRAATPSTYHPLLPSGTPLLLPIPSTSCRADIPKADTPPQKRLLFTAPRPGYAVESRVRDTERRMMAALEVVNLRKDRAAMRAETEMWNLKAIEFTTELMDEKTHAYAERQAEKKRRYDDLSKNNQNQQQQNKRQNTGQAYTAGNSPCPPRCNNCKKVGHLAKDCRSRPANANNNNRNNNNNNQKGNGCYECGAQGHFKRNCPKLKNNDRGNQARNHKAPAKVYVVGNAGANPDNVVAGTFLLNHHYAYILFDTGADRSFVSTQFSALINIAPTILDHGYNVELADGRIIW